MAAHTVSITDAKDNMKNILPLILALVIISCTNPTKENKTTSNITTPEDELIIKDLVQGAFDDLWAGFDSTKVLTYHTPDFIILENGEVWDNARIKLWMKNKLANPTGTKRVNSMEYIAIDRYGPSIQASYWNYAKMIAADSTISNLRWLESAVAVPTNDGWRLKMMHSTWSPDRKK